LCWPQVCILVYNIQFDAGDRAEFDAAAWAYVQKHADRLPKIYQIFEKKQATKAKTPAGDYVPPPPSTTSMGAVVDEPAEQVSVQHRKRHVQK
jgi:hypothetical protein